MKYIFIFRNGKRTLQLRCIQSSFSEEDEIMSAFFCILVVVDLNEDVYT